MRGCRSRAHPGVWLLALSLLLLGNGCTAGRVLTVGTFQALDPPPRTIALAPRGGVFADLIGIMLAEEGYIIIDTGATAALLALLQRSADDLLGPQSLGNLRERGIDAVLVTEKVDGNDGLPQTVSTRLYSTARMVEIGGVDWENSWVRRGVLEAAQEIAAAIAENSRPAASALGEVSSRASIIPGSYGPWPLM
jgi:hypothetical protein